MSGHRDSSGAYVSLLERVRDLARPIAMHYGPHSHKWERGLVVPGCPFCDLLAAITEADLATTR